MAEENQGAAQESRDAQMIVQHVFLKDTSYEAKSPHELEGAEGQPDMNVNLSQRTNQIDKDRFEVVLTVTLTAKQGEQTAFLCEVQYGGIFQFSGFTDQQMPYVLNVLCPNVLFPYNRTQISSIVAAGGYFMPPIQPINFESIFRQRMQEAQAAQTEQTGQA
jgi:preprotein translocase subunit SecB